jgi:large subunit ribosomal protein L31
MITGVFFMKEGIHPAYNECHVTCVCGNSWTTHSTADISKVDICNNCHPFYSGKQKLMDSEGRIDKFNKKYANFAPAKKK